LASSVGLEWLCVVGGGVGGGCGWWWIGTLVASHIPKT